MHTLLKLTLAAVLLPTLSAADQPLRLCVAGLVHGHVDGFLRAATKRTDVQIAGIFEPDTALQYHYAKKYGLADAIFFTDMGTMLDGVKPEAVASFTSTFDHAIVVQACGRRHIHVMMEKPLAVSMADARTIERAAHEGGIQVMVNYETTWYPSHAAMWRILKEQKSAGEIRRMVAMDGHEGPKEINVGPEFLGWLTDPVKNGAGALFDFGCYGANLMTWMMDNQRPVAVTAITQTEKPGIYAHVDDEASVLVEYPRAQGVIEASWNWPFGRKDFEVYGEHGYAVATGGDVLHVRLAGGKDEARPLEPLAPDAHDSLAYLTAVVRGKIKNTGLSSLENNMIVTEILTAARESAKTGKTVKFEGRASR
jgi:predicted dehydrogenase